MLISGEIRRKKFERHLSTQPAVLSEIDFTHSARGQRRQNLVWADLLARQQPAQSIGEKIGGQLISRDVEKGCILFMCAQERFHFVSKIVIATAGLGQKADAFFRRTFQRRMEEFVDVLPSLGCHDLSFNSLRQGGLRIFLVHQLKRERSSKSLSRVR